MPVRPTIDQVRTLTDFVTSYQWYLQFNTFPKAVSFKPTAEQLNLRCISSEVPILSDQSLDTSIRGHKVWQPGIHNYIQTITLTMAENIDMLVNNFLKSWREACWETRTGVHQKKSDVECEITLVRLNRQDKPIWKYHLIGCFLADYTQDTLGTENALFRPTLKINYDYFKDSKA